MKRLTQLFLSLLVASLLGSAAIAAPSVGDSKEWVVPALGVFKVPQEFTAGEFKELKKLLDEQKEKMSKEKPAVSPLPANGLVGDGAGKTVLPLNAKPPFNPDTLDMAFYQLSMNDGQSYHVAWLLVVRDQSKLSADMAPLFKKPVTLQQKLSAIMALEAVNREIDKMEYTDSKTGVGFKLLEVEPVEFPTLFSRQGYAGGARFLVKYQEMVFPFYTHGWFFSVKEQGAAMLLITLDSERSFWTPVMNDIVPTLKPTKEANK